MSLQNLMKLAAQHAEEQKKANEAEKIMEIFRMLIITTTINDFLNQDAIDKSLKKSANKVLQMFKNDCKPSDDEIEQLEAIAGLANIEVKIILKESAKLIKVKQ